EIVSAIAAAAGTYACARTAEALVLRVLHPQRLELLFLNDFVLAMASGLAVYLALTLRTARTRLTDLERAQVALDTQRSVAATLQRHLLPKVPVQWNGLRCAARLEPAGRIGGDFYDFIRVGDEVLCIVGDVAGKGIPAALVQTSAHSLFRMLAHETSRPD